ncbi:hypothetical protein [Pseudonocardia hydrocarbonoxydans]|uniref:ABC transporter permease n=1 Tax=Pseudonocardia hydrocarbonoxydans TaxID=76726 RepID=A0A4Y3WT10_9PSEU|nr:hypothetical protein [Pseudonocardia hydrocarbonoxydans]GEC22017.1 hypothetical protein PHY01_43000 [Pseudonocardia hydrocarbonoxydans]
MSGGTVRYRAGTTGGGWGRVLRMEAAKFVATPSYRRLLAVTAALMVLLGCGYAWLSTAGGIGGAPLAGTDLHASFLAVNIARLVVVPLGVLVVADEFASGQILLSLRLCPGRTTLLLAKAAVLAGAVAVVGLGGGAVLVAVDLAASGPGPGVAECLRLLLAGAAQPALVAVFALGVAAVLRSAAGAVSGVLAVFLVLPLFAAVLPGVAMWLPHTAANGMLDADGAGAALLLAAWAVAALALGAAALQVRRP